MALLATGVPFDLVDVDLTQRAHRAPGFLKMNPFGTVPLLEDSDDLIPETGAILLHLAERFPASDPLPQTGRAQALGWVFHAAAIHADAMTWSRVGFAPNQDPNTKDAIRGWMAQRLANAFRATEQGMVGPFLSGATPGAAEIYLLMVAGWWQQRFDFAAETPRLAACLQTVADSPSASGAYERQGAMPPDFLGAERRTVEAGQ